MLNLLLMNASTGNTALGNTIVTLIAFIILLAIVKKFTWQPFMTMLEKRRSLIEGDIQKAAEEKALSIQAKQEAQQALREARSEANQIILTAKKQSLQIQDNMVKEAKEEAEQIREAAKNEMAQERARIFNEVKNELSDIAIEIAEKILHREISNKDHHNLINDFIQGMDDLNG